MARLSEEAPGQADRSPRPSWAAARATGVVVLVLAAFFAPAILSSAQFLFHDTGLLHAPIKRYLAEELSRGHFPQWNPYLGLGTPIVAGAIDAVQHPFNLLLVLLPFEIGFKGWVLLSYFAAALGMFGWARALGRSQQASLAAGLAFALSGHLVSSSDNLTYLTTYAALPWVLCAAQALAIRISPGRLAAVGLASGLCAAGGDPQGWGLAMAALPIYVAGMSPSLREGARRAVAGLGAALLASAPFILPLVLWLSDSARGEPLSTAMLRRWNMPPLRLVELGVPHVFRASPGAMDSAVFREFYGDPASALPWVLSVYAGSAVLALALLGAGRSRAARVFLVGATAFAWMALGHHAGFSQLAAHLPVLEGFRYWEKVVIGATLLLCAAASFGIDELLGRSPGRHFASAVGALGALGLLAGLGLGVSGASGTEGARELIVNLHDGLVHAGAVLLLVAVLAAPFLAGRPNVRSWLLVLVVAGDLMAANAGAYVLLPAETVAGTPEFARYIAGLPGLQRLHGGFYPVKVLGEQTDGMTPAARGLRWISGTLGTCWCVAHRVGCFVTYAGTAPRRAEVFVNRAARERAASSFGIWGVGHLALPNHPGAAEQVGLRPPLDVVASDPELPATLVRIPRRARAYLAGPLRRATEAEALEFALSATTIAMPGSVVEAEVPADYRAPEGEVWLVADGPERVVVGVRSSGPGLLVLNDVFAGGWTATVGGKPAGILPANYLARGVWIPAGESEVVFRYRTPGWAEGWGLFLLGGLALAGWTLARRRARLAAPR